MIVTRSWLEEFIDLSDISNEKLYETFNSIGLEVDSLEQIAIPEGVVIGRVISCEKHPDADKLNVCQIDIGEGIRQIVCGAANIVDAKFVAVATIGTMLDDDFRIKPTELRGVQSDGMVCSSTELGLPKINNGIMILDDSIGTLNAGRELNEYSKVADTIIELELTANRGDCLSIHGIARDLSAAFQKDIKDPNTTRSDTSKMAIARKFSITSSTSIPTDLLYKLSQSDTIGKSLLIELRLGFVELEIKNNISNILQYSTHATGVILRAYDALALQGKDGYATLSLVETENGLVELKKEQDLLSIIGISQNESYLVNDKSEEILFEASYIEPNSIIEGVAKNATDTDLLYYKTSRGSEPNLGFGISYLESQCAKVCNCGFADSHISVESERNERLIGVSFTEINEIIGQDISKSLISNILTRLGLHINRSNQSDSFGISIPPHRHDIKNVQDIAEEILRIVGINNIHARPLNLTEKNRITKSAYKYKVRRDLRLRAVGKGFFEAVTYAFSDRVNLEKYGFDIVSESKKLINPIAEEFNAMRSTLLINLLDAVKRNTNYGIKRIPLFEIGTIFDSQRNESEKIAFVWSGSAQTENVSNHGKASTIDFASFIEKLSAVIGDTTLMPCREKNKLMHPYQSANIIKNGDIIGYVSKLHPAVAKEYGIADTFFAELDFASLIPMHIIAKPISNYQGVYKDLSIVVDSTLAFTEIAMTIDSMDEEILKSCYPVDIYTDKSLGEQKSITIRLFIQSMNGTMSDQMIDSAVQNILSKLENECGAKLR